MTVFECVTCGASFKTYPCRFKSGMRYCSRACSRKLIALRRTPLSERFWSKVNKNGPRHPRLKSKCWVWTGHTHPKGHGMLSDWPRKPLYAHRVSWQLRHGEVRNAKHVLHKCDVARCVNPRHLYLGTNLDNIRDRVLHGRNLAGEKHPFAKMSSQTVRKMRSLRATSRMSYRAIADKFGVSVGAAYSAVTRRTWTSVK